MACMLSEEHFQELGGDCKYQKECQEIAWNVQQVSISNPRTQRSKPNVQNICNTLQITCQSHLPTITVSLSPIILRKCAQKSGGTNKDHSTPHSKQEGEKYGHNTSEFIFPQATKDIEASDSVNARQLHVDRHLMGSIHPMRGKPPEPSSIVHTMIGRSETQTQPYWETRRVIKGNKISSKLYTFMRNI